VDKELPKSIPLPLYISKRKPKPKRKDETVEEESTLDLKLDGVNWADLEISTNHEDTDVYQLNIDFMVTCCGTSIRFEVYAGTDLHIASHRVAINYFDDSSMKS